MTSSTWLEQPRRTQAADRIVDAAARLFAERGVASVGMAEVADAAGCSRATLYRYFENRDALRGAFVDREAGRIGGAVARAIAGVDDPADRLVTAAATALAEVRADETLMSWFTADNAGTTVSVAHASTVIGRLASAFLGDPADPDLRARSAWLVRALVSLLVAPGGSVTEERDLLARFVVPVVLDPSARSRPAFRAR